MPITNKMSRQGSRTSLLGRLAQSRARLVCLAGCLAALAMPSSAIAAESALPTTQARAYGADWVPYLDPPAKPAAVCLVDSGINITPDTPADSPDGPILERSALDGGTGEAAGSSWEQLHGTRMAMAAAAPINGWGTVGFAPGVRIVSVRAMPTGKTTFPFDDYRRAIDLCVKNAPRFNIAAINLSLGCNCAYADPEVSALENKVVQAANLGISVVSSAGNSSGPVGRPASAEGIVAVGAADSSGTLCSFSNYGNDLDLIAPGCELNLADPLTGTQWSGYAGGTSAASMAAAGLIALLRAHRPELSGVEAARLALGSAKSRGAGPVLNAEAAFSAAGLDTLVETARSRAQVRSGITTAAPAEIGNTEPVPPTGALGLDAGTSVRSLPTPTARIRRRRGGPVVVTVTNRPDRATVHILGQVRRGEFGFQTVARVQGQRSRISIHLRRAQLSRVLITFRVADSQRSRTATLKTP